MEIIYKKTSKGLNEIASRTDGLALKLRPYLIVVDGNKSVKELVMRNPALKDLPQVLTNLSEAGFIARSAGFIARSD